MFSRKRKTAAPTARSAGQKLLSLDFVLLFFLVLFSNCYLAVYYCFEQWLEGLAVAPDWRGLLLGALFGMVMVTRPLASVYMLRFNKLPAVLVSLLISSGVLLAYQYLDPTSPLFEWYLLILRLVQGFFLAIFSSCVISLLVECIPPGQSARGFALFSLTGLLPYALLPSVGELLLPLVGGEAKLFAWTSALLIPCLVMTILLAPKLKKPEISSSAQADFANYTKGIVRGVTHSGLGLVFAALLTFSLVTQTCIFFMKGLCSVTGTDPAKFFFYYTVTIMIVRVIGSNRLDTLPRYRIVPVVACTLATSLAIICYAPTWLYIPAVILYGISISLLYPLMASVIYNRSTPETRTVNSNLMMLMFDAAGVSSPLLGGTIMNLGLGYQAVISAAALMALVSGLCFTLDRVRLAVEEKRQRAARASSGE